MDLLTYLKEYPAARLASNRNQAIWVFLSKKYNFEQGISKDWFWKHGQEIDSTRREITELQNKHAEVRGADWKDRKIREEKFLISKGYEPGYNIKLNEKIGL